MIFDILSSFEVLFLFECNRCVRRFQHSRETEFRTSEFPNNWILHARNSNLGASQFWSRGVAIPISGSRNSSSSWLSVSQFPLEQFLRGATPMQRPFLSMLRYFSAGRFSEWQFQPIPREAISARRDFTVVELVVFTVATRFDSTRDNSSAPRFYVQRF